MIGSAMEHQTAPTSPMLSEEEKVVIVPTKGRVGKILIREDTVLANLQGCAGCGRAQFACSGMKEELSVLCWGRPSDRKYYCSIILLSLLFVLSLLGTVFFCFTNTLTDAILSNMVIRNNSRAYSVWQRPNVQPLMKVHIFNYTNWRRVRSGVDEKLHVESVGPYVYSQQLERVNIKFADDTVTFQEKNTYTYMPHLSSGSSMDVIEVPNLPLLGFVSKMQSLNGFEHFTMSQTLSIYPDHPDAFVNLTVPSFLWGYDDKIIDLAKIKLSFDGQLHFTKFGLLVTKNGTGSDVMTINTGQKDMSKMNFIEKFNGAEHLPYWGTPQCNSLESTDGTMIPPSLLDKHQQLQVFFPNLCRRLPYEYEKEVEYTDGIKLLRYRLPEGVFDDPTLNKDNECYCSMDTANCPPRGLINLTACTLGAPVLASFPHFYAGDPSLKEYITGLEDLTEPPANFLDFHPTLGIALSGKSSLQLNFQVMKTSSQYSALRFLKDGMVLPIAWIEMGLDDLPESLKSLVYHGTYSTAAAQLGLMIVSVISFFISGVSLCIIIKRRRKPCATIKAVQLEMKNQGS